MNYRIRWFSKHLSKANSIQEKRGKKDLEGSQIQWLMCGTFVDFSGLMVAWALHAHSTIINAQSLQNKALTYCSKCLHVYSLIWFPQCTTGYALCWLMWRRRLCMLHEVGRNVEMPCSIVVKKTSLQMNQTWARIMDLLFTTYAILLGSVV